MPSGEDPSGAWAAGGNPAPAGGEGSAGPVVLRIHGVGGSTPHDLLGERDDLDTVLVAEGDPSGFWARRRDRRIRGYLWGPLTSGSPFQALWPVLLPFTVLNVAGWMHRPSSEAPARVRATRRLVTALGYTLTASWVLWLAIVVVDLLAYRWGRGHLHPVGTGALVASLVVAGGLLVAGLAWRWVPLAGAGAALAAVGVVARLVDHPGWRVGAAVAVVAGAMAAVALVAGRTQAKFEKRLAAGVEPAARRKAGDDEPLDSPRFYGRPGESAGLLWRHVAVLAATVAVVAVRAGWRVAHGRATLGFGTYVVAVGGAQFALLWAIVATTLEAPRRWRRRWRAAGPATAAALAVALSNAFFGGLDLWVGRRLGLFRTGVLGPVTAGSSSAMLPGAELAFLDVAAGVALALVAVAVTAWLPYFLVVPAAERRAWVAEGSPGQEDRRAHWAGAVAARRRLARAIRHVDVLLTAGAATLLVATTVAFPFRVHHLGGLRFALLPPSAAVSRNLAAVGEWGLLFAVPLIVFVVRTAARSLGFRRQIGNAWDVMTFFPRRFHPFAVRPYTERAVPELQDHIRHCLDHEGRPVVVAAHSQGTVIAFAALAGLDDDHLSRVALVTYGSPLSRLFGRFFPAYFSPSDFERLAGRLFDDGRDPPAGWRSFYRRTDQIGQRVFDQVPAEAGRDEEVPDPAEAETPDDVPPFLEPDVAPWAAISGHNAYPRERAVKRWVAAVAARMDDRSG